MVILSMLWIPFITLLYMSDSLYVYMNKIQSNLSPPIAAAFLWGILWKGTTPTAAFVSFCVGLSIGILRLCLEVYFMTHVASGFWVIFAAPTETTPGVNFLHFGVCNMILCSVIILVVSQYTDPPDPERIKGLRERELKSAQGRRRKGAKPVEEFMTFERFDSDGCAFEVDLAIDRECALPLPPHPPPSPPLPPAPWPSSSSRPPHPHPTPPSSPAAPPPLNPPHPASPASAPSPLRNSKPADVAADGPKDKRKDVEGEGEGTIAGTKAGGGADREGKKLKPGDEALARHQRAGGAGQGYVVPVDVEAGDPAAVLDLEEGGEEGRPRAEAGSHEPRSPDKFFVVANWSYSESAPFVAPGPSAP
eukprot:tig00000741_g3832.t1